jgi:hypothetical protein
VQSPRRSRSRPFAVETVNPTPGRRIGAPTTTQPRTIAWHGGCSQKAQEDLMSEEKKVTETKTKNDIQGNPKELKTTTKETRVDDSGNKKKSKTEYKEKR